MSPIIYKIVFLLFASILFAGCAGIIREISGDDRNRESFGADNNMSARVLLKRTGLSFEVPIEDDIIISKDGKELFELKEGTDFKVSLSGGKIKLKFGNQVIESPYLSLHSKNKDDFLTFDKKRYRGEFDIISAKNDIYFINRVSLEDYVRGVIPLEMGLKDSKYFEALKAAAVAARTFAIMKMTAKGELYDLTNDTRDQVYGGFDVESSVDDEAVKQTINQILTYHGEPAKVFYYSSCGGSTEDVENVFSAKNIPYLITIRDGEKGKEPNCSIAPGFKWREKYSSSDLISFLYKEGLILSKNTLIENVEVDSRFESGRVKSITFTMKDGKSVSIPHRDLRKIFRRNDNKGILRSNMFDISVSQNDKYVDNVILTGTGNGHGVGLCQWGAFHLSAIDYKYKDILEFYFPGTKVSYIK